MGGHAATPNSEVSQTVSPGSQNATSTVPERLKGQSNGAGGQNNTEATKIVKTSPGV